MLAEIITIGDEILIGQIVDTNSAFLATTLNKIGVSVYQISSVQDDSKHILSAFEEAESRADLVIITGGLGPTKDDITKHTLCEYFQDTLVENREVLEHVEELFRKYISTPISDLNRRQALVPSKAEVLHNAHGTAPGMWMQGKKAVFVSLPGVPYEMKQLVTDKVIPRIISDFELPVLIHRTLLTYGLGESAIANRLEAWEEALPPHIKLAYLPNLRRVRLRLSIKGKDREALHKQLDEKIQELKVQLADILMGESDGDSPEEFLGKSFIAKGATLAIAESCTGGKLASVISAVPGASAYFLGGMVTYATASKTRLLGVPKKVIEEHSVVSEAVACKMAKGVREKFQADFGVATTGNAGPTKGDSPVEIGTVFIGISTQQGTYALSFQMGRHRERVVQKTVAKAIELLGQEILNF